MNYYILPVYVFFGVLPSLIWLIYYLRKDLHQEPKKMITKVFLWGALITVPVFFVEIIFSILLNQIYYSSLFYYFPLLIDILKWFFAIALTEEIFKYLIVKWTVFKSHEIDEPSDVIIYIIVAALGFAAVENILYMFSPLDGITFDIAVKTTIAISFVRFIGATFLHTLSSGILGYFLVLSFSNLKHRIKLTVAGIFIAAFLHGLYNFSIMSLDSPLDFIIPIVIITLMIVFLTYSFNRVKKLKSFCKIN